MHDLAKVTRIQSITPIEGKDRIELAKVENYDTVVSKGDFKPGDRCVYIFYDSILPPVEDFEFLRKRCWSEKLQGFHIRPIKLGGIVSEGLVMPMSILPEGEYKDEQVVTDLLGIRLYEPPEPAVSYMGNRAPFREKVRRILMKNALTRGLAKRIPRIPVDYPPEIKKSDEDNIEALWEDLKGNHDLWYLTEKMEGQSATYILRNGKLECYSHNMRVWDGSWVQFAEENKLRKHMQNFCRATNSKGVTIQGELCGPGIQKNIYKLDKLKLFVFGMFKADGTRMDPHDMCAYSAFLGLDTVPFIDKHRELPSDIGMILAECEGKSLVSDVQREGVVWRSETSGKHFKAKSRSYKVWFDGK